MDWREIKGAVLNDYTKYLVTNGSKIQTSQLVPNVRNGGRYVWEGAVGRWNTQPTHFMLPVFPDTNKESE